MFSFLYVPLGFIPSTMHFRIIAALQCVVQVVLLVMQDVSRARRVKFA